MQDPNGDRLDGLTSVRQRSKAAKSIGTNEKEVLAPSSFCRVNEKKAKKCDGRC